MLEAAHADVVALSTGLARLADDRDVTLAAFRGTLSDPRTRRASLSVLSQLDTSFTLALIQLVVEASISHRDALLARQVVARMSYASYAAAVPPVVDQLLEDADDDAYRRLAELLDHLGLYAHLQRLSERASDSSDADIREVGSDFAQLARHDP